MFEFFAALPVYAKPAALMGFILFIYFGNMFFWWLVFQAMKQIMIGMEINHHEFFTGSSRSDSPKKDVFQCFMVIPGYSIYFAIKWIVANWLILIGKTIKRVVK